MDHVRQDRAGSVNGALQVGLERIEPVLHVGFGKRPNGPLNAGGVHQHMDRAVVSLHSLYRRSYLFVVADIAPQPQRLAAGVFNFELRKIEFRFAAA